MAQYDFIMNEMISQLAFEEKFLLLGTDYRVTDLTDMEEPDEFGDFMFDGDL